MKIFGDYFSSEMRAILTALDYAEISYDFEHIDSLRQEQYTNKELKAINPACMLPTMQHGDVVVIGGYGVVLSYLATTYDQFAKTIYKSNDANVSSHVSWYQAIMRPTTEKVLKQFICERVLGNVARQQDSDYVLEEVLHRIMPKVDKLCEKAKN